MAGTFINNRSQLKLWSPSNHARQLGDRMDNFRGPAKFPLALGDWASANPYPCLDLLNTKLVTGAKLQCTEIINTFDFVDLDLNISQSTIKPYCHGEWLSPSVISLG